MKKEEYESAIQDLIWQQELENNSSNLHRGRAITCGTAFNDVSEITIRGDGDKRLWVLMYPKEIENFIHQLAANIGCTASLVSRTNIKI